MRFEAGRPGTSNAQSKRPSSQQGGSSSIVISHAATSPDSDEEEDPYAGLDETRKMRYQTRERIFKMLDRDVQRGTNIMKKFRHLVFQARSLSSLSSSLRSVLISCLCAASAQVVLGCEEEARGCGVGSTVEGAALRHPAASHGPFQSMEVRPLSPLPYLFFHLISLISFLLNFC